MRSGGVFPARPAVVVRVLLSLLAAVFVLTSFAGDAEARRRHYRKHHAGGGYNPPYASMVYDVNSGRTLEATNADAQRHPASVTKVMTLYMLFEQLESGRFKLSTELPVSREAASQAPSKLGLRPGDTIAVEDAIKALVTKSANDVAVVVAEAIGGDEESFARMMTRKARSIGMSRTTLYNASGLPNPRHTTTARDLVTLGKAIQDRFPRYYPYFGTRVFTYDGRGHRNHNRLLGQVEGVDGIKTGYTRASGFNLLTSAKADGRHLITVVLGGKSGRSRDAQVASLIENHMDRAYAGRRQTAKTVEVAAADDRDDDEDGTPDLPASRKSPDLPPMAVAQAKPAPAVAAAPLGLMAAPSALPQPPSRPRPAVIAETGSRPVEGTNPGLTRARPLALTAAGSTGVVAAASSPLAMVATTPRSPTMRWVESPRPPEPARVTPDSAPRDANRLVPPANVRYTNAMPGQAPVAELAQPLPAATTAIGKVDERLPSMQARAEIAAQTPPPAPEVTSKTAKVAEPKAAEPVRRATLEAAKVAEAAKAVEAPKPATRSVVRSGWAIQLAAAESDAKAMEILNTAKTKSGGALARAEAYTESVSKGSSTLYRARFGGFDEDGAQNACKAVKRAGFNCFTQRL